MMEGGDIHAGTMTVADAVAWCGNSSKCGGFCSNASASTACPDEPASVTHYFRFKDHWGASRVDAKAGWSTWLMTAAPPETYVCQARQCVPGTGHVQFYDKNCLGLCTQ